MNHIDKQAILRARAEALAARGTQAVTRNVYERIVLIEAGSERYGLPLTQLREIALATSVTPLPGTPHFMPGVSAVRGEIMSVVDLAELRGHGRTGNAAYFAVVEVSGRVLALWFSNLLQMRDVFEDELIDVGDDLARSFVRAVTRDRTLILDLPRLVASERMLVGKRAAQARPARGNVP
jgi:purine-binding chemotaxis protein CheW